VKQRIRHNKKQKLQSTFEMEVPTVSESKSFQQAATLIAPSTVATPTYDRESKTKPKSRSKAEQVTTQIINKLNYVYIIEYCFDFCSA
jgi:hypothetical protein